MKHCRYQGCRKEFVPPRPNWAFCTWDCHEAHFRENDYRGYVKQNDANYDRGYWDGSRMRFQIDPGMPLRIWTFLRSLVTPDRKGQLHPLHPAMREECATWLDSHKPARE